MSAESLTTAATLFAGPNRSNSTTPTINDTAGFHLVIDDTIQTLSTKNTPNKGPVKGLLFVPSLAESDPCNDLTARYIPHNVTRHEDVSSLGYDTIGLAPWTSIECTQSYLSASRAAHVNGMVFFMPSSNDTKPPPQNDPTWNLGDGEVWKSQNNYPIYAIPGAAGMTLMHQLAVYSGNATAPDLHNMTKGDPGVVRLFTLIDLDQGNKKMPSLWGFILAILGTILVLSIILLLCYQLVQKRRRENLQRRLDTGEADLEQLGLHQLKVPREIVDTIPMYVYPDLGDISDSESQHKPCRSSGNISIRTGEIQDPQTAADFNEKDVAEIKSESPPPPPSKDTQDHKNNPCEKELPVKVPEPESGIQPDISPAAVEQSHPLSTPSTTTTTTIPNADPHPNTLNNPHLRPAPSPQQNRLSRSQTTCAICLDDFTPGRSIVRELPCGHIYHPECIDVALTQNSCLCPLCKKSVLPTECYPTPVTNSLVHRESVSRRMR